MKYKKTSSIFVILIILTIPFYISSAFAQEQTVENVEDAGQRCIDKHKKNNDIAEKLDNEVISELESIASIMFMICTTMSAIDSTLSVIAQTVGMFEGLCCHSVGPGAAACGIMDGIYGSWKKIYKSPLVEPICCFVSCGWCTGQGCGGIFERIPIIGEEGWGAGMGGAGEYIGQMHISPYENIYTATGCLCPIAVLFNLRKLKTIYQTYNCCVEQACTNGISTIPCEKQLDEALCMYYEGAISKTLIKVLASILTGFTQKLVLKIIGEGFIANCLLTIIELAHLPNTITNVVSAWNWMGTTFDEPSCNDLGFDKLDKLDIPDRYRLEEERGSTGLIFQGDKDYPVFFGDIIEISSLANRMGSNTKQLSYSLGYTSPRQEILQFANKEGKYENIEHPSSEEQMINKLVEVGYLKKSDGKYDLTSENVDVTFSSNARTFLHEETHRWQYQDQVFWQYNKYLWERLPEAEKEEWRNKLTTKGYEGAEDKIILEWAANVNENDDQFMRGYIDFLQSDEATKYLSSEEIESELQKTKSFLKARDDILKSQRELYKTEQYKEKAAYELTWEALNFFLEEFAYEAIDKKCEEDWEASDPPDSQPSDSGNNPFDPNTNPSQNDECIGIDNTIITAQILSHWPSSEGYRYQITYTITACKENIDYQVSLKNNIESEVVHAGQLEKTKTVSDTTSIGSQYNLDRICIYVSDSDVGEQCFPP